MANEERPNPWYPLTLFKAFSATNSINHELANATYSGAKADFPENINLSNIYSKLIEETGRWTERYGSDLIISIDALRREFDAIRHDPDFESKSTIHAFGIRRDGVDGNLFLMSRLYESSRAKISEYVNVDANYRKILLLEMDYAAEDGYFNSIRVTATLRDATTSFLRIEEDDKAYL